MVGQNFSVRCQYKPEAGPYVPKSWCRQTSPNRCNRVVTTSEPRKAIKESQHAIWDDPEAGFFSVTITPLTEKDSAVYWCGSFNPSRNVINILRNISLVVSPGEAAPRDQVKISIVYPLSLSPPILTSALTGESVVLCPLGQLPISVITDSGTEKKCLSLMEQEPGVSPDSYLF